MKRPVTTMATAGSDAPLVVDLARGQAKMDALRAAEHEHCMTCGPQTVHGLGLRFALQDDGPVEHRSGWRTERGEATGITGTKRGGRLLVVGNRRATKPGIPTASLATGAKPFDALELALRKECYRFVGAHGIVHDNRTNACRAQC